MGLNPAEGKSMDESRDVRSSNESPPFFKEGLPAEGRKGWFSGCTTISSLVHTHHTRGRSNMRQLRL
jgi:hypothetical protein